MSASFTLGPFTLTSCLAVGGMAEVWLAEHRRSSTKVAVKVLTSRRACHARFRADFRREVATLARLSHPNIIPILEHGLVTGEEAEASGRFSAHAPYLVTEEARGGSLSPRVGTMDWPEQLEVIRSVLCALGHAHARGVIHRDLKPANVLLPSTADAYPLVRLADFGLVHAVHQRELEAEVSPDADTQQRTAGTPTYMAPEQFMARWQYFGPWTDLYALGVLVWELTTGRLPFRGEDYTNLALQHLDHPVPSYVPEVEVPEGLEHWLRRLLEKNPMERFTRARDALRALEALSGTERPGVTPVGRGSPQSPLVLAPTLSGEPVVDRTASGPDSAAHGSLPPGKRRDSISPGAPSSFEEVESDSHRLTRLVALDGVGWSLLHLRIPSMVGRESEREALWALLEEAVEAGEPRVAVIRGGVGVGKSRLSRWVGEAAHEEGVANVLSLRAEPGDGPGQAIARSLARLLRCEGHGARRAHVRIVEWLHEHGAETDGDARPLLELLLESGVVPREEARSLAPLQFGGDEERFAVLFRVLERLAQDRPLVVEVEDVHHDPSLLTTVRRLVSIVGVGGLPCLVLVTALDASVGVAAELESGIEEVVRSCEGSARVLEVGPLSREQVLELLHRGLGVQGVVAVEVAERSAGNPQLAVELVRDLVRRRQLTEEGGALVLRANAELRLPETLRALLSRPVEALHQEQGLQALNFLELAAVLGHRFEEKRWTRLIDRALPHVRSGLLIEEILSSGVLVADAVGQLRFAHEVQRDILEERCRKRYRWARWNGFAAALFEEATSERDLVQLARFQEESGERSAAVNTYLRAMKASIGRQDLDHVLRLLERRERLLRVLDVPQDDERWLDGWLQVMHAGQSSMNVPRCQELARKMLAVVDEETQPIYAAEAYRALAFSRGHGGEADYTRLERWAEQSLQLAEGSENDIMIVRALDTLATLKRESGHTGEAASLLVRAQEILQASGTSAEELNVRTASLVWKRAILAHECGQYTDAVSLYETAALAYDSVGARNRALQARSALLTAARDNGADVAYVEEQLREILDARKALSVTDWLSTQVNLGFTLCINHKFDEALEHLLEWHQHNRHKSSVRFVMIATTFLLFALAGMGRVEAWREHFAPLEKALEDPVAHHAEGATALEKGAELLEGIGHAEEARRSMRLAHLQWRALGREEEAKRSGEALARLEALSRRASRDTVPEIVPG